MTDTPIDGQDPKEQGHFVSFGLDSPRSDRLLNSANGIQGQLKAKLAKLKRELLTPTSSGGGGGGELSLFTPKTSGNS